MHPPTLFSGYSRLFLPRHSLVLAENQSSGDLRRMKKSSKSDSPLLFSDQINPNFEFENRLLSQGKTLIAGVDEVGRGPLAGSVVAASVILDPENYPDGLNDSKKLTQKIREILFSKILTSSTVSFASIPASIIDRINIRQATLLAMKKAVHGLSIQPDMVLVDGRDIPEGLGCDAEALVKGDSRSLSIAAASIVAKVIRDRQMCEAAKLYPEYGFERHKGYGSRVHLDAISKYGPCPLHRLSFSPFRNRA